MCIIGDVWGVIGGSKGGVDRGLWGDYGDAVSGVILGR